MIIQATPILKGNDAKVFLQRMNDAVMTPERLRWLQQVAEESRQAEKKTEKK